MACTVVGVFDDRAQATRAQQDLVQSGVPASAIKLTAQDTMKVRDEKEPGFWDSVKDAFGFSDESDRYSYAEAARRGSSVLSVTVDDAQADRVADIIDKYNPVDIDERQTQWKQQGWSGYTGGAAAAGQTAASGAAHAAAATTHTTQSTAQTAAARPAAAAAQRVGGTESIPVVQEELQVGKRAVKAGGVRVFTRIVETPVQEQVSLREEHVHVERHAVNRPVTAADDVFKDKVIEATAMAEQAVVGKTARVVEEVTVRKDVDQHTETIRDTVRKTDVNVEQIDTDPQFAPAREFATTFFADQRYRGRSWDEIEPDARTSFEQRHPGKWNQFRDAIRAQHSRASSSSKTNA